ncbi:MAG: TldD/PmbA family protein [Clostridiales bacterium]|nr:TldD/PmbA family protein [Clostridiales bacterium]MDD7386710.1 TldD/PmbA family protein [Bacillota bacterium]MDY6040760.1 TldD/PmbA family protein [Candidatus Faecousia sp.]
MISREICQRVLQKAVSTGADYAEIFAENTVNHVINMIADKVDSINDAVIAGAAVRVYKGLRSVMASTVDMSEAGLLRCAESAAEALGQGEAQIDIVLQERLFGDIHPVKIVPSSVPNQAKVAILKEGYFAAREYDSAVKQVTGGLLDVDHNILIANSEGLYTQDRQIRTRMFISAVAEMNGETQTGSCAPGRRMGLEMFNTIDPKNVGIHAARQAVTMAGAGYCPAGVMPVAIENGFGGVIFHEACGHSLEATSVALGQSQFTGKLGQKIANEKVTAIDDGTIPGAWGSINIDDEGTPAQRKVLIENGVLKSYMIDKFNGRRMGMASTGSSRRQSYRFTPTSRMTNTYIAPGQDKDADIIASIAYGLYAKEMGGGSVNPITGEFNFAVNEGYLIRNGKICEPVRGASLVGKGSEIIQNIDMVGANLDMGQGMCGSSSGSVPTNVGQPLIRVSSITVGGR